MKKWIAFLLISVCFLGMAGCRKNGKTDLMPLSEVSALVSEKGYEAEDLKEFLLGQYHEDVTALWGEPDGELFGCWGDIWHLDEEGNSYIILYYDTKGYVENIILETPDSTEEETIEGSGQWDLIPMVMVNGELYLDTGRESTVEGRCGNMDGEITSAVDGTQKPTCDDQSNFGTGYGYQYGPEEGTIELNINGKWWVFATETAPESSNASEKATIKTAVTGNLDTYYEMSDGTWQYNDISYRYRLEITGRLHNAACDTTYVYLSNLETISFDQAWRASGLSSNTADYFSPEDAVLVDLITG